VVLYGRCDEDLRMPYQPFVQALSHYVDHAPFGLLADHVATHGGELLRLVPSLARRVPGCPAPRATDPDAERYLAFGAAEGLFASALRESAVLLVLDDLHWADKPSLVLLRHLASSTELAELRLLGSFRSSEFSRSHDLADVMASLHREVDVVRVDLAGFTDEEVLELAEHAAGHPLDIASMALARAVRRGTAGNPFFVIEMLRHLAESGMIVQDDSGRWSADVALGDIGLPQSVREVVVQRVRRLGDRAERILLIAANIGVAFDLPVLAGCAGLTEDETLDLVEQAQSAALVEEAEEGGFAFTHALVQQALTDSLTSARRRMIHRKVAEVVESIPDLVPETRVRTLAHHWAEAGEVVMARRYTYQAGTAALAALAPDEAVRWFERSLRFHVRGSDDAPARCDVLIGLGTAQRTAGDPSYRTTLLAAGDLAQSIDDPDRMAEAALAGYRGFWSSAGAVDDEKVAALEGVLAHMDDADSPTRARVLATLCNELTFSAPLERRRELADQAKTMANRLADPSTTVYVLTAIFDPLWVPGTLPERLADTELALARAEEMVDPVASFSALGYRGRACMAAGRIGEADRCLERMEAVSDEVGQPILAWVTRFTRGCRALLSGDTDEAERVVSEAFRVGTDSGQPDALLFYGAGLSYVRWEQGRLGELVSLLEDAARATPGIPGYWAAVARALCEEDRLDEARALLDEAADQRFAHLPDDAFQLPALVMFADTAIRVGAVDASRTLYDLLDPWRDQWSYMGVASDGPVVHYLAGLATVIGEPDLADHLFAEALEAASSVGAQFFAARTQLDWAQMLLARNGSGDDRRAQAMLDEAVETSLDRGYAVVTRRAIEARSSLHPRENAEPR
jgi:tetratricopeptide (TPR) repeat protein